MICDSCGRDVQIGRWPFCPHGIPTYGYFPDEIPGGQVIENLGHDPVTVYSRSELTRLAASRGLESHVRHIPHDPGSDKSRQTQRWI